MKYLVWISRIIVGVLFIISGLIKLNDPLGFSFKLEEYFSPGVLDLPFLVPMALGISIVVVIVEVLLGVMLLIGFKPKLTVWSLLAMIEFFTFLKNSCDSPKTNFRLINRKSRRILFQQLIQLK